LNATGNDKEEDHKAWQRAAATSLFGNVGSMGTANGGHSPIGVHENGHATNNYYDPSVNQQFGVVPTMPINRSIFNDWFKGNFDKHVSGTGDLGTPSTCANV
jgi:hypothetical protein